MSFISKKIRISYGVTVCNEAKELERLTNCLLSNIDDNDEVIILSDKSNVTAEVLSVIDKLEKSIRPIKHISYSLNGDFATYKNNLIDHATSDYLFQIDADEIPSTYLLKHLKWYLWIFRWKDCFRIPRVNYVEGITDEHIKKWNWKIDQKNRINYPDFQMRLFKLNKGIKWKNKVHETLINWSSKKKMPYRWTEKYCLYHPKQIARQERQNELYDKIGETVDKTKKDS